MIHPADERVVILDRGTPLGFELLRAVRQQGVFAEILPFTAESRQLAEPPTKGIVIVNDGADPGTPPVAVNRELLPQDRPILTVESPVPESPAADAMPDDDELHRFLFQQCRCAGQWSPAQSVPRIIEGIKERVGKGRLVAGLSGGVDSTVAAALVHRAVGERLTCVFVDNGLLRQGEAEEVPRLFQGFGWNVIKVNAADRFLRALAGVVDPEEKRQRIGTTFFEVFGQEARRLGDMDFLLQGTLYPDVIESGSLTGEAIKTHHNVGDLPATLNLQLLEPLRFLFKDEVRQVAVQLQLPEDLIWRQPFPGPGLAIRIMGEVTPERLAALRQADAILRDEIRQAGLERDVWQYFAVLTGARAVGTRDGRRFYGEALALRAVTGSDAVTAGWAPLPYGLLAKLSDRLLQAVPGVARVVYDITAKPPGTIEWE